MENSYKSRLPTTPIRGRDRRRRILEWLRNISSCLVHVWTRSREVGRTRHPRQFALALSRYQQRMTPHPTFGPGRGGRGHAPTYSYSIHEHPTSMPSPHRGRLHTHTLLVPVLLATPRPPRSVHEHASDHALHHTRPRTRTRLKSDADRGLPSRRWPFPGRLLSPPDHRRTPSYRLACYSSRAIHCNP